MHGLRYSSIAAAFAAMGLLLLVGCNLSGGGIITSGTGSCTAGSFRVSFSGAGFVTGLGWSTGLTSRTITWSGTCTNCDWGPAVYGWMTSPLVEYYIPRTTGDPSAGTYPADGTTYTLRTHQQVNQPSIIGTATFWQYLCGGGPGSPVNFGEHVAGWQSLLGAGSVGTQNYQVVAVESWSGDSGSANVTVTGSNWYTHWIGSGSATFYCGQ